MTRPKIQNICDFCGKEIAIDAQEYTAEFSQKGAGRGKFVKATPKADVCHPCFLEVCKTGFKPVWQTSAFGVAFTNFPLPAPFCENSAVYS